MSEQDSDFGLIYPLTPATDVDISVFRWALFRILKQNESTQSTCDIVDTANTLGHLAHMHGPEHEI